MMAQGITQNCRASYRHCFQHAKREGMECGDRPRPARYALNSANRGDVIVHNMEELQADLKEWLAEYNGTRQVRGAPSADAKAEPYAEQRKRRRGYGCGRLRLTQ